MHTLNIDIETFSSVDLTKSGVYKYVESPDFEILLFACSYDHGEVLPYDLTKVKGNLLFSELLTNPNVLKIAYNANFERVCLSKYLGVQLDPAQWECTMVKAGMLGLPMSLDAVTKVLNTEHKKDAAGKALIRFFTMPCKSTKANDFRTRNLPEHAPEKWQAFKDYCVQDVKAEMSIGEKIKWFNIPEKEKQLYCLDQRINDRGVMLDKELIEGALKIDAENAKVNHKAAQELSGLQNPNSAAQLKKWLLDEAGEDVESLSKDTVKKLIDTAQGDVLKLLQLRQEMSKSSIKKYAAMLAYMCEDGRARGLFAFCGANRTGRWAGRGIQPQNLARNKMEGLTEAREAVKTGSLELMQMFYESTPYVLSQLTRTAFIAKSGYKFDISDFSAIEARIIAWLAGERWRLDVFNTHGKIYEASAAAMFKIPIGEVDKEMRQKGKIAELALGYQGGENALLKMGAFEIGLTKDELPEIVERWRAANPAIVKLWGEIQLCAKLCITTPGLKASFKNISFQVERNILFINLPSGRRLAYIKPNIENNARDFSCITYWGMDQTTKQWCKRETYGGKLVENIIQAIARDILAEKMLDLDSVGAKIVMHIHDEIVIEVPENKDCLKFINSIMSKPLIWAPGLPLGAEGFTSYYYKKE